MNRTLGVLISGRGSNLQAIIDAIAAGTLDARIGVVISNRPEAAGLERARRAGIETLCLRHRDYPSREDYDRALVGALRARDVGLVCLAGFMRLLEPRVRRGVSERDPEHPSVAAAGVPRPRCAAPGLGPRREGQRRHRAPGGPRPRRRADRPAAGRAGAGRRHGGDALGADPGAGAPAVPGGDRPGARRRLERRGTPLPAART